MAISFQGFPSLVENNPDAISLLDNQGEILHRGASGAEIFWANQIMRGCDLGLAPYKKIIKEFGCTMWIESNAAKGATFCFTIRAEDANMGLLISHGELV